MLLIGLSLLATNLILSAAGFSVIGHVLEGADQEPCIGAMVRIWCPADSAATFRVLATDENGRFSHSLTKEGEYKAQVQYLGCQDEFRNFAVSRKSPSADLGDIRMVADGTTLDELLVIARRKLISSDGATLTYNVEDDPTAQTDNTMDMLRRVPMVTIDADENVKISGQSNFKIYINGKEDPMLNGDLKTILKSMPASSIKKIEVITEPGAKYDAEGVGGILNIVTNTKTSLAGYLVNVNAALSNNSAHAGVYGMTKVNKVTASVNANYSHSVLNRYIDSKSLQEISSSLTDRYKESKGRTKATPYSYVGGNLNLSWEPDTLNLFTLGGNIGRFSFDQFTTNTYHAYDPQWQPTYSYNNEYSVESSNYWASATASYQHTFGRHGHHIIGSYIYDYGENDHYSRQLTFDVKGMAIDYPWRSNDNTSHYNKHTLQLDYSNPILDGKHLLEAGAKAVWWREKGNSQMSFGQTAGNLIPPEADHTNMTQYRDVAAAYLSYGGKFGSFNVKGGLRYEYTSTGVNYHIGDYTDFSSRLHDWVPNAAVSYNFTTSSSLRAAYQMRISRPQLNQLNPYVNMMTLGSLSYGNPSLESERNNNVSLSYSNYGKALSGSASVTYSQTNNMICNYDFINAEGIVVNTYANIGRQRMVSLNCNLQWTPISSLQTGIFAFANYSNYKADSPQLMLSNHGWNGGFNANADYTFPFKLRMSAYGGYGSRWVGLQTDGGTGWYYYGFSFNRSFLKEDRLTLTLSASNFLPPRESGRSVTVSDNYRLESTYSYSQWQLMVGITMKFGSLKASVKSTAAQLETEGGASVTGSSNTNTNKGVGM